jgi:hypothetical protein
MGKSSTRIVTDGSGKPMRQLSIFNLENQKNVWPLPLSNHSVHETLKRKHHTGRFIFTSPHTA